jgi:superfamily II DNA or RNA helicase
MSSSDIPAELRERLWPHQNAAIKFALKRLRGRYSGNASLVRMPTGTGKTGVIAVLSVALPPTGWTLVLTPWKHLCVQMIDDLSGRFWKARGWTPKTKPDFHRLYPSTLRNALQATTSHSVLVATFATLVSIFKRDREGYDKLAAKLGQVLVDEGHYEPAVEWGQAVKNLKTPTLLLTATPYRNDLKLFRVNKDDVFNFTHRDAVHKKIIRKVIFKSLDAGEPTDANLQHWCREFVEFWNSTERKKLHSDGRAIVCCSRMATVERVTHRLRDLGLNALGIHEGFARKRTKWLKQDTPDPKNESFDVWVHQNKLTEGLDDSRFCVVAILNRIRNDRKLIQQIGRVLRTTVRRSEKAIVVHSDGLSVERSWQNYLAFEVQPHLVDPERYRHLLDELLNQQPPMEYFGGRFRQKFNRTSSDLASQILLRSSCVVRRVNRKFDWNEFVDFTSDFLLLEDCILLGPKNGPVLGPGDSQLWVYAVFGNTPLLIEHSQYELRLGATAAVRHDDMIFIVDTEGLYPAEYLGEHATKISPDELGRIFAKEGTTPKEVSLVNSWPSGPVVKSSTLHADNLSETPAQLSDAVFVCSTARANVKSRSNATGPTVRRHYVGFQRGRLSEELRSTERSEFSLKEFVAWTKELGQRISAKQRKPPDFFRRYLSPVAPPPDVVPQYLVLNLIGSEIGIETEDGHAIEFTDSIIEVTAVQESVDAPSRFECELRYRQLDGASRQPKVATAILAYDNGAARFRVKGTTLNSEILVFEDGSEDAVGLVTYLNNNDESFAVALSEPEIFYTAQSFYRIDYTHAEERLAGILDKWPALATVGTEKGLVGRRKTNWDAGSIFSLIDSNANSGLIRTQFGPRELLFCDDLNKEPADFICANFTERKIAFIHAKQGTDHVVSASALQIVVAQAQKNLGLISRGGERPAHLQRWNRESIWPGTRIRRWRFGRAALPTENDLWAKMRSDILDHPQGHREVWLVLGRTLESGVLLRQLRNPELRDAVTGQVVYLLSSLHASCIQLGVRLRVFCH